MKQNTAATQFLTKSGFLAIAIILILIAAGLLSHSGKTVTAETPHQITLAHWNTEPQILAQERGNPWINVQNGREIITDFAGTTELRTNFENNHTRPLSLVTADFDEDGMPDIIAGYAIDKNGAASFMRGNVDAVYPNSPEAKERKTHGEFTDTPFASPAQLFVLPVIPDFLAAGDFDADGHFDIAIAARTENAIYFLKGDGRGEFILSKRLELSGKVTAFLADDFNRRDGLNDLIIAVQNENDSQLLIFENPYGASKAAPEVFTFAAPIKSLAIGLIEGDARFDLAIAAGNELAILRGRDRKLLFDASGKQAEAVQMSRRKFDFEIAALAVGDFIKGEIYKNEIALLSNDGVIHLLEKSEPPAAAGGLSPESRSVKANNPLAQVQPPATAGGSDSWREKETVSLPNNLSNGDTPIMLTARVSARSVDTLIVGTGSQIHLLTSDGWQDEGGRQKDEGGRMKAEKEDGFIHPSSFILQPSFKVAASLDVASRPTAILPMRLNVDALSDLVVLREDSVAPTVLLTAPTATFTVVSNANVNDGNLNDGACLTPPCDINGVCTGPCTYPAARQQANATSGSSVINFSAPSSIYPSPQFGIGNPLTIDGTTQPGTNLVEIQGTSSTVSASLIIYSDNCVVRGMVANGFAPDGYINIQGRNNITIEGNRIGTNAAGTAVPAGGTSNRGIIGGGDVMVGGTTPAARNIISTGNAVGVDVGNGSGTNKVQGNFIGTDVTGTAPLGNKTAGVNMSSANVLVGGTTAGAGNVISATTGDANSGASGVSANGGIGDLIQGNRIGTNASGTAALGNMRHGISVTTSGTLDTVGGTTPAARNIISGNVLNGLSIIPSGVITQQILGNFIGTNAAGSAAIPNGSFGLVIIGSQNKLISNNVISGNAGGGVSFGANSIGNSDIISGNLIGTDATGSNPLGNTGVGLLIGGTGGQVQAGATVTGNTVAANSGHGIVTDNAFFVVFQNNFIGTNSSLSAALGNGGDGMRFNNSFSLNQIGAAGAGNTIAFNGGNGINLATSVISSTENRIAGNSIFSNGGLGIDLGGDGVSANDNCDGENGPNSLQNYPVISAVNLTGAGNVRIVGSLNSTANQSYTLHFYANTAADTSGFGEGQQFIGTTGVAVPAGCQANFSVILPRTLATARCISATATDSIGDTSEFSRCIPILTRVSDFDSDGLADLAVFRPSNGTWYNLRSSDGTSRTTQWGIAADKIVPADYDGDGINDIAVFRDGTWYLLRSQLGFTAIQWGSAGDIPLPFDYDGDGIADLGVYRNGIWFVLKSSGGVQSLQWGISGDIPVVGDYDGDGKADFAVFRNGFWYLLNSQTGFQGFQWGIAGDKPVPADYDGDGKTDLGVFRNGTWYILRTQLGAQTFNWGSTGDIPTPADYDGDGKADFGVFRNGTWYLQRSTSGVQIVSFGLSGDKPIPAAYIP